MQTLGYIISKTRIRGVADFVEVVSDPSLFESEKPAMIVGLEMAKKTIDNFSIINKNPKKDKFWTFGKTERRIDFDKDIIKFYDYILESKIEEIKYYYVNVLNLKYQRIKNLLNILYSDTKKWGYIYKNMLYLYHEGYILGISMEILNYMGIDVKKHLNKILKNSNIKIFFNDTTINPYMKQFSKNKRFLIPYFLSLME